MKKILRLLAAALCLLPAAALGSVWQGSVEAARTAEVRATADGILERVPLRPGEWVTADTEAAVIRESRVFAPFDGRVNGIRVLEGEEAAGQTVLTLVQTGEMEVEISVPENKVSELTLGMPVSVNFWALKGRADGTIREISPMADPTARTYKVRVAIPEPPEGMQLGMTANVSIKGADNAGAEGAVLPLAAIFQDGDTPQVWVVDEDNKLTAKAVTVENLGDDKVLVTGLNATDLIVTAGVHKLHEGQTVRTEAD